jgi:hypothetical protein
MLQETPMPPSRCPYCEALLDIATAIEPDRAIPKAGDLTLCLNCAQCLIFGEALYLRKPLPGEMDERYADDPPLREIIMQMASYIRSIQRPRTLTHRSAAMLAIFGGRRLP